MEVLYEIMLWCTEWHRSLLVSLTDLEGHCRYLKHFLEKNHSYICYIQCRI